MAGHLCFIDRPPSRCSATKPLLSAPVKGNMPVAPLRNKNQETPKEYMRF